jgi:hypothetical protein
MGVALGIWAYVFAGWALIWPTSFLWNARLLPFLYLCRFLLVAIGTWDVVAFGHRYVGFLARERAERAPTRSDAVALEERANHLNHPGARWLVGLATLVTCALVALFVLGMRFGTLPGGTSTASGYEWLGLVQNKKSQFVDDWARWNYSGYEGKAAYGEYHDLVNTMRELGEDPAHGCGRALWEHNSGSYGTPMALMLLPFWTDGCIASMEGLYFEASATTPYHFLAAAALSKQASNPVRRLQYTNNDVDLGVRHLQDLGVKYYLAYNPEVVEQANEHPDLTAVRQSGPWTIYEVADAPLVEGLTTEPVVVRGRKAGLELGLGGAERDKWLEVGTSWFQHPEDWPAMPTDDGPEEWQRVDAGLVGTTVTTKDSLARVAPLQQIEATTLPEVEVSNVQTTTDTISFTVDEVGVPVLVRMSYYPNWTVEGAEGPYRVAPNFMVVVPTESQVTLSYDTTRMEWISYLLTGLGLALLMVLWRRGPIAMDDPVPVAASPDGSTPESWSVDGPAEGSAELPGDPTPPAGMPRPVVDAGTDGGTDGAAEPVDAEPVSEPAGELDGIAPEEAERDVTAHEDVERDVTAPDDAERDVTAPDDAERDAPTPEDVDLDVTAPENVEPDDADLDAADPDDADPDVSDPDAIEPDAIDPDDTEPEERPEPEH